MQKISPFLNISCDFLQQERIRLPLDRIKTHGSIHPRGDADKTPAILARHYIDLVPESVAAEFWGIRPAG